MRVAVRPAYLDAFCRETLNFTRGHIQTQGGLFLGGSWGEGVGVGLGFGEGLSMTATTTS